jgi:hypothetical protein
MMMGTKVASWKEDKKILRGYLVVARDFKSDLLYVTQVKVYGEMNVLEYNPTDL